MRIAISGTSGVGKTFLENVLHNKYGFVQIPKYTNRPKRPTEVEGEGIYFMSKKELKEKDKDFFFSLEYMGYDYKWKKDDLQKNIDNDVSIGITLESLKNLTKTNLDFIPIVLYIEESNINFLENRIKKQLDYLNLDKLKRVEADNIINKRLDAVLKESKNINEYIKIVKATKYGNAFKIEDDSTIEKDIIPYILKLKENAS